MSLVFRRDLFDFWLMPVAVVRKKRMMKRMKEWMKQMNRSWTCLMKRYVDPAFVVR